MWSIPYSPVLFSEDMLKEMDRISPSESGEGLATFLTGEKVNNKSSDVLFYKSVHLYQRINCLWFSFIQFRAVIARLVPK